MEMMCVGPAPSGNVLPLTLPGSTCRRESFGKAHLHLHHPDTVAARLHCDFRVRTFILTLSLHCTALHPPTSHFTPTPLHSTPLHSVGFLFVGSGVSGGEEGARYGPSIMPGGNPEAWPHIKDILQGISAKVGDDACCDWVGPSGAGKCSK